MLIGGLFKQLFNNLCKDVRRFLRSCLSEQKAFNITSVRIHHFSPHLLFSLTSPNAHSILSPAPQAIKTRYITDGLKYSLATGNWGDRRSVTKAGVSQVLNRLTYASSLSHLRRLNTPLGREGKQAKPRQLHNTHWGMVCPAETPEGQAVRALSPPPFPPSRTYLDPLPPPSSPSSYPPPHPPLLFLPPCAQVGLVKNLALMAYISRSSSASPIVEFLQEFATATLNEVQPADIGKKDITKIFINGTHP